MLGHALPVRRTHPPPHINFNDLAVTTHWSCPQAPGVLIRGITTFLKPGDGDKVIRIEGAGESLHAKWVAVTDADITSSGRPLVKHSRRMLRFNAEQLWQNLIRQGWKRVPPQW
jgi:hypothetical protein